MPRKNGKRKQEAAKRPEGPKGELTLRMIAMPADANPQGDIFGGWLLSIMDLAAGNLAHKVARGRVVTAAVDAMSFHRPVFVGDELSCYARLVREGTTSMTVRIEAWRRRQDEEESWKVTEGDFVYVALGDDRRPRPLPGKQA